MGQKLYSYVIDYWVNVFIDIIVIDGRKKILCSVSSNLDELWLLNLFYV